VIARVAAVALVALVATTACATDRLREVADTPRAVHANTDLPPTVKPPEDVVVETVNGQRWFVADNAARDPAARVAALKENAALIHRRAYDDMLANDWDLPVYEVFVESPTDERTALVTLGNSQRPEADGQFRTVDRDGPALLVRLRFVNYGTFEACAFGPEGPVTLTSGDRLRLQGLKGPSGERAGKSRRDQWHSDVPDGPNDR